MAEPASFELTFAGTVCSRVVFAPLHHLGEEVSRAALPSRRIILCSDEAVFARHGEAALQVLGPAATTVDKVTISGGEAAKNLDTVRTVYTRLAALGTERGDVVVALGGGVVGDLFGYVAATYLRGLALVQVPTTVVAQVDSSIGGKVGVDLPEGKNLVGAFKHPALVLIDNALLDTLPDVEWIAGTAEVVKHGVIADQALFAALERNAAEWRRRTLTTGDLLATAIAVKARIVQQDERESGARMTLNYGHTFGHALEAAAAYRGVRHGEAVAWGMAMESRLALALGRTTQQFVRRQDALLMALGLLQPLPSLRAEAVLEALFRDKKVLRGRLRWVLPGPEPGQVSVDDDVPQGVVHAVLHATLQRRLLQDASS